MVMAGLGLFAETQRRVALTQAQRATLANLSAASAISPDGTRMLQSDPGGDLRIIGLATGRDISVTGVFSPDAPVGAISAAIFSPDGRFIATGTVSGTVSIADSALKPVRNLRGHKAAVTRLAFSPDGGRLASGSDDTTARFWSVDSGALLWVITADSPVVGVAFSPDGLLVIVSSQNGKIFMVDSQTGRIIR
jgi:WD40 repeat protein